MFSPCSHNSLSLSSQCFFPAFQSRSVFVLVGGGGGGGGAGAGAGIVVVVVVPIIIISFPSCFWNHRSYLVLF